MIQEMLFSFRLLARCDGVCSSDPVYDNVVSLKEITDFISHLPIVLLSPQGHFPAHDQV